MRREVSHRSAALGAAFVDVLAAARVGAGWAAERLYGQFAGPVAGYLRAQGVVDPDSATNEVFLRAFRRLGEFAGDENRFRSWIFTIAHNLIIDDRRFHSRRPSTVPLGPRDDDRVSPPAEAAALERAATDRVEALLGLLPPDQRDALLLRFVADLSVEQIADATGRSVGAVKQLQRRGLVRLRTVLADANANLSEGVPL